MNKFEMKTPPNMLEFRHTSIANEWVMRITADRRVEVNEDVEVTEAAKKVLEAMQHMLTPQPEQERCVGCEACIDTACGRDECPKGWPKAAQPEQEPVACVVPHGATMRLEWASVDAAHNAKIGPLYTTPPQRTWVGLTDEEIMDMYNEPRSDAEMIAFGREVESKLKEKNT